MISFMVHLTDEQRERIREYMLEDHISPSHPGRRPLPACPFSKPHCGFWTSAFNDTYFRNLIPTTNASPKLSEMVKIEMI